MVREAAVRAGWVDHPDGRRRLHRRPVARTGGLAVFGAFLGALGVLLLFPLSGSAVIKSGWSMAVGVLPSVGFIFAIGLLDDIVELRPWQKLAGQFGAAGLAIAGGVRLGGLFGHDLDPWLSIPATVVWLVGCSNAFNLIDGVDGLAAGTGAFATVTILVGALMDDNFALALLAVPLLGAILGFLRYNFDPASIFLGDSGSLTIGFLLGCFGLLWSQKSATVLGMTAPVMALALPIVDTAVSIGRRFLNHQPIFGGDRDHIHHRLLKRGLTPRRAVLILYCACALGAVFSLLGTVAESGELKGLVLLAFCISAWIGINRLGYQEFGVAGKMLLRGAFQSSVKGELQLRRLRARLSDSDGIDEQWTTIQEEARQLGFHSVEMDWHGERLKQTLSSRPTSGGSWTLVAPITAGEIRMQRSYAEGPLSAPIEAIARALNEAAKPRRDQPVTAPAEGSAAPRERRRAAEAASG